MKETFMKLSCSSVAVHLRCQIFIMPDAGCTVFSPMRKTMPAVKPNPLPSCKNHIGENKRDAEMSSGVQLKNRFEYI